MRAITERYKAKGRKTFSGVFSVMGHPCSHLGLNMLAGEVGHRGKVKHRYRKSWVMG